MSAIIVYKGIAKDHKGMALGDGRFLSDGLNQPSSTAFSSTYDMRHTVWTIDYKEHKIVRMRGGALIIRVSTFL